MHALTTLPTLPARHCHRPALAQAVDGGGIAGLFGQGAFECHGGLGNLMRVQGGFALIHCRLITCVGSSSIGSGFGGGGLLIGIGFQRV